MGIQAATDETVEELVLHNDKPVVVDFWAAWCGPCRLVAPEMERLAEKYEGAIDVVKVDVDANPRISQAFNIMSLPTIALFRKGQNPLGLAGARPLEAIEAQWGLEQYTPKPAEASTPAES
jgi:thioredoxin 1